MAANQHTINLIHTQANASPEIDAIDASVRKAAIFALIGFICVAVITASVYGLYFYQQNREEAEKADLITRVNSLKNKEAYLLAIKDRTKTVEKALGNQKPWIQMLNLVSSFVAPPFLSSITVDEQDKIALIIRSDSLEDILRIVDAMKLNTETNKIKNPQLVSFQILKTGDFEIAISFYAVFTTL